MSQNDYLERTKNGTSFSGSDMNIFGALALAMHLKNYATIKMLPTRGQTATGLLEKASSFTGKKYKRGQYLEAANDLTEWGHAQKGKPKVGG